MTDHPSTFKGEGNAPQGIEWDDRASLHLANDGGGVLDSAKALRSGNLAEMVSQVMAYPEADRARYVIEKAGDHRLSAGEIQALAARADYPGA